jgi:drug/metabolite transporter (DMT)-like permease
MSQRTRVFLVPGFALLAGKSLRSVLDNRAYATALYGLASLAFFVVLLAIGLPVVEYPAAAWLCFGLMALVPTVLGHTGLNHALKYLDAGRVSLATLAEPALAGTVAWLAWAEPLTLQSLAGYAVIAAAVVLLVTERRGLEAGA